VGVSNPPTDDFWNAPFGAAQSMEDLGDVAAVLTFFTEGKHRVD
jgi:hypothetical protein